MYSRGSTIGKNIWDDERIHIPPGYKGNAFQPLTIREPGQETAGKIHPPKQKLYTSRKRTNTNEEYQDVHDINRYTIEEDTSENKRENRNIEETNVSHTPNDTAIEKATETVQKSMSLNDLFSGVLHSLDKEEWLLFFVILLLLADGSEAWDVILLLLLLLGVH